MTLAFLQIFLSGAVDEDAAFLHARRRKQQRRKSEMAEMAEVRAVPITSQHRIDGGRDA